MKQLFFLLAMVMAVFVSAQEFRTPSGLVDGTTSSGGVGVGITAAAVDFHVHDANGTGVTTVSSSFVGGDMVYFSKQGGAFGVTGLCAGSSAGNRAVFKGIRSRGTTASPSKPNPDDYVLSFLATGYDGSGTQSCGAVDFFVDGATGVGTMPMRIAFSTSETNSGSRVERLKIRADGDIEIPGIAPGSGTYLVNVATDGTLSSEANTSLVISGDEVTIGTGDTANQYVFLNQNQDSVVFDSLGRILLNSSIFANSDTMISGLHKGFDFNSQSSSKGVILEHTDVRTSGIYFDQDVLRLWCPGNLNRLLSVMDSDAMQEKWYIDGLGNMYANGSFYASDRRLKTNIQDFDALGMIGNLNPVQFDWKDGDKDQYGLIAQEVNQYYPEFVTTEDSTMYVNYISLIPVLVKAIQELQAEVNSLKN